MMEQMDSIQSLLVDGINAFNGSHFGRSIHDFEHALFLVRQVSNTMSETRSRGRPEHEQLPILFSSVPLSECEPNTPVAYSYKSCAVLFDHFYAVEVIRKDDETQNMNDDVLSLVLAVALYNLGVAWHASSGSTMMNDKALMRSRKFYSLSYAILNSEIVGYDNERSILRLALLNNLASIESLSVNSTALDTVMDQLELLIQLTPECSAFEDFGFFHMAIFLCREGRTRSSGAPAA